MSWAEVYDDNIEEVSLILENVAKLKEKLKYLENHVTLKNALKVVKCASDLQLSIGDLEWRIERDFRANWINPDEYKTLINKIDNARNILAELGWER